MEASRAKDGTIWREAASGLGGGVEKGGQRLLLLNLYTAADGLENEKSWKMVNEGDK